MWVKFRQTFILGILTAAPIALTIYVFVLLFGWFDALFQPIVRQFPGIERPITGLGIVVGVVFIYSIGVIAPSLLGKQFFILMERVMERLPLAKLVYSGTKQIFDTFSSDSFKKFNRVVLIQFPREGMYALGFVTADYPEGFVPSTPDLKVAVFVPTTPNPTSGYLVFISASDARPVNISVEEALKLIISGGLVKPELIQAV